MKSECEVKGLIVSLMGNSYEVMKLDRYEETGVQQTTEGESYTTGEIIDLTVKSTLSKADPKGTKELVFARNGVVLETLHGELSIEPLGQEARIILRTIPKPVHLPDMDEDAIGKLS